MREPPIKLFQLCSQQAGLSEPAAGQMCTAVSTRPCSQETFSLTIYFI